MTETWRVSHKPIAPTSQSSFPLLHMPSAPQRTSIASDCKSVCASHISSWGPLCLFTLGFLSFGLGRTGCDPHPLPMILKHCPVIPGPSFSGLLGRLIFALMNASSAVIGEAARSSWHAWPQRSGMSAGGSGPLGNQSCFSAALSIRNAPEWHLWTVLSVLAQSPALSSLRLMVIRTSSLLFSHHRVELFHFPLHVLILPPCFILSRLSQKI